MKECAPFFDNYTKNKYSRIDLVRGSVLGSHVYMLFYLLSPPITTGGPPALQMKTSFNVPETSVGAIIGKAGMFLKNICRLSGAQVNVSKDTSEAPAGERKIDIIGTAEQVSCLLVDR